MKIVKIDLKAVLVETDEAQGRNEYARYSPDYWIQNSNRNIIFLDPDECEEMERLYQEQPWVDRSTHAICTEKFLFKGEPWERTVTVDEAGDFRANLPPGISNPSIVGIDDSGSSVISDTLGGVLEAWEWAVEDYFGDSSSLVDREEGLIPA